MPEPRGKQIETVKGFEPSAEVTEATEVSLLLAPHAVSFERLARLMSDLIGLKISEGALQPARR